MAQFPPKNSRPTGERSRQRPESHKDKPSQNPTTPPSRYVPEKSEEADGMDAVGNVDVLCSFLFALCGDFLNNPEKSHKRLTRQQHANRVFIDKIFL